MNNATGHDTKKEAISVVSVWVDAEVDVGVAMVDDKRWRFMAVTADSGTYMEHWFMDQRAVGRESVHTLFSLIFIP